MYIVFLIGKKYSWGNLEVSRVWSISKFKFSLSSKFQQHSPLRAYNNFFFWGGGNIAGAIINFIQYYTPITTFALQSSHPLVFQAAWEVIKIKLQPCTLQPWFMAISLMRFIKRKTKIVQRVNVLCKNFFSLIIKVLLTNFMLLIHF